jgi:hypothetical protein
MEMIVGIVLGLLFKSLNEWTAHLREIQKFGFANFIEGLFLTSTLIIFYFLYLKQ